MSADLHHHLDASDAVDAAELDPAVGELRRVRHYASALLAGEMDAEQVDEVWSGFFGLVVGFVFANGSPRVCRLQQAASLFEGWDDDPLTSDDRDFLETLLSELDDALRERALGGERAPRRLEGQKTK